MDMTFLDIHTTDPAFNLALEQYVFDRMPRSRGYFLLWQNDNAVIVGRHQNTLAEINEDYVRERGIRVVRRLSGGGAVYHDLGNLNFTYIVDASQGARLDLRLFCQPVAQALRALGADAQVNGRNDITIDGKKFSGNAQYVREGRIMHHGTIMFDCDLAVVGQALRVDTEKIAAKGVKSVRSRVTNVRPYLARDVSLADFKARLVEQMFQGQQMERYELTAADVAAVEELRRKRYATWEWNYGASPTCAILRRRRMEGCGTVEARLQVEGGRITGARFYGDFFSTVEPEELAKRLVGLRPLEEDFTRALAGVDAGRYFTGLSTGQLVELLSRG